MFARAEGGQEHQRAKRHQAVGVALRLFQKSAARIGTGLHAHTKLY